MAPKALMSSGTRRLVLWISAPVVAFVLVGGLLGQTLPRETTYQQLKIFEDVVRLISNNYVDTADMDRVMGGAMIGLADSLDPDSAYLPVDEVKRVESGAPLPAGDVGLELTRQYYLRVVAARDGSPAAQAGLQTGDYVRVIGDTPTRYMSAFEGMRALRGAPGTSVSLTVFRGNANDPRVIELTRTAAPVTEVTTRLAAPGVGYVRVAAISARTAAQVASAVAALRTRGAAALIVDVRRTSGGVLAGGLDLARLFVAGGPIAVRESQGAGRETIEAGPGAGTITMPTLLLVDTGTSGAAELFASALAGNARAELVGEATLGRAAEQRLLKLPDGSGLWLTTARFLTPAGDPLHERGLQPTVAVDQPIVDFGEAPPTSDPVLEAALEHLALRKAA
jgi:carboxyl-terminal processing protease